MSKRNSTVLLNDMLDHAQEAVTFIQGWCAYWKSSVKQQVNYLKQSNFAIQKFLGRRLSACEID